MQVQLFRFCNITPIDFWDFTPAETELMISTGAEKYNQEFELRASLEARLCAVVLNANGARKKGKKPFEVSDFLPQKKEAPKTVEQLEHMAKIAAMKLGGTIHYKT